MSDNVIAAGPELHLAEAAFMNLSRPYQGGSGDPHLDVRLRIGIIDHAVQKNAPIDPLNASKIINMATGKVCIRWLEYPGGIIRPPEFSTGSNENYDDFSDREMIGLTHPIMWNSGDNWMGINYMPPVGSVVVVGFRKNNLPVILGFLQQHYSVCEPLKLGEIMIAGYGRNTSHWKQDHEQEHKAWISQGEKNGFGIANPDTVGLRIKIKAGSNQDDDKNDDPNNPVNRNNKRGLIELYAYRLVNGEMIEASALEVKPESISLNSFVPEDGVAENDLTVFNKVELTKDALNFSSSNSGGKSNINMTKDSIGFSSSTTPDSSRMGITAVTEPVESTMQINKDNMLFSSKNADGETTIDMNVGSILLQSKDVLGDSKIELDLGKIQLLSTRLNETTGQYAINQIKVVGNDAFIDVAGDINMNAEGNVNLNAQNKVNVNGVNGVKFDGLRIDF